MSITGNLIEQISLGDRQSRQVFLRSLQGLIVSLITIFLTSGFFFCYLNEAPTLIFSTDPAKAPSGFTIKSTLVAGIVITLSSVAATILPYYAIRKDDWETNPLNTALYAIAVYAVILVIATYFEWGFVYHKTEGPDSLRLLAVLLHLSLIAAVVGSFHRPLVPSVRDKESLVRIMTNQYRFALVILYVIVAGLFTVSVPIIFRRGNGPSFLIIVLFIGNFAIPMMSIVFYQMLKIHMIEKALRPPRYTIRKAKSP